MIYLLVPALVFRVMVHAPLDRRLLAVVVSGWVSIALCGVLAYGLDRIDPERDVKITLIEAAPRVLPALDEQLAKATAEELRRLGIELLTGEQVVEVTETGVRTSSGRFVLPSRLTAVRNLDLRLVGGIMEVNGVLTSWSCGAAALGDPAAAVAWLANALAAYGTRLDAGRIVLSGALDKSVSVKVGDVVRADFDRLGSTSVSFE